MFERFTDQAQQVIVCAQEEAALLNHAYVGTEHLLLGILKEGGNIAAQALSASGVELEMVRAKVEEIIGRGKLVPHGHIPFTPRHKKVLDLAGRQALQFGHGYMGPEHLLLGLLQMGNGVATDVLEGLGVDKDAVRRAVIAILAGGSPPGSVLSPAPKLSLVRSRRRADVEAEITRCEDALKVLRAELDRIDAVES